MRRVLLWYNLWCWLCFLPSYSFSRNSWTTPSSTSTKTIMSAAASKKPPKTQKDYAATLSSGAPITSDDVATLPRPGSNVPTSIKFSSDGKYIVYLQAETGGSLSRKLLATEVSSGETSELLSPGGAGEEKDFTLEEKLRRERLRMMATGVTSFVMAPAAPGGRDVLLVPLGGALWFLELGGDESQEPRKVAETRSGDEAAISSLSPTQSRSSDFSALTTGAPLLDAKISADGSTVAFVCDDEVYAVGTAAGAQAAPKRLTDGARGRAGVSNGVADYVAQEELDRPDGFWLSPRGGRVAFESVDESHIPAYRITHQGEEPGLSPTLAEAADTTTTTTTTLGRDTTVTFEEHRFPFAGAQNPAVKLGVVAVSLGSEEDTPPSPTWFDLASVFGDDFYLARVEWLPPHGQEDDDASTAAAAEDSTRLIVQLLDRRQLSLALVLLDCESGGATVLHVERAMEGAWLNLHDDLRVLAQSRDGATIDFLWASERDGYRHLYVLQASTAVSVSAGSAGGGASEEAKVLRRLTGPGDFIVDNVVAVDKAAVSAAAAATRYVYFMGTAPGGWLEKHLYRVPLEGGALECLTGDALGMHACVVHASSGVFVDTVSSALAAPVTSLQRIPPTGAPVASKEKASELMVRVLHDAGAADERVAKLGTTALAPPSFHTFPSSDGAVTLQAAVYRPDPALHGPGPYPIVVATYGGPHVQYVCNSWSMTVDMRSQYLRSQGFLVIKVDNRGSNRRGLVFEAPIRRSMGSVEVADQVAGVEWAADVLGLGDKARVAVSGWSYGGYMALKCLCGRPDIFHAGISGAPVTDWALYDTAYTERYMDLPQLNPEGYAKSSALVDVQGLEGSLLLCHGLLDENVLFRQSAVLVNALIKHRKAYDLALFPSERHGPRRQQDRAFLEERILAFLQRSLGLV